MQTRKNSADITDSLACDRWFTTAITVYVVIEAVCIAALIYLWLSR
jgi:hypothetical protein